VSKLFLEKPIGGQEIALLPSSVLCLPHPYPYLPHVPISSLPALFRANASYPCSTSYWFALFCGRQWKLAHLPCTPIGSLCFVSEPVELTVVFWFHPFSYRNLSFRQVGCSACYLLRAGFFFGLLFDPEDGGDVFLRNVGWSPTNPVHNSHCFLYNKFQCYPPIYAYAPQVIFSLQVFL
jgi:hypothetical protein